jgi:hypothetical protein
MLKYRPKYRFNAPIARKRKPIIPHPEDLNAITSLALNTNNASFFKTNQTIYECCVKAQSMERYFFNLICTPAVINRQ